MILCTMGGYSSPTQTDICRYLKLTVSEMRCLVPQPVDKLQSILAEKGITENSEGRRVGDEQFELDKAKVVKDKLQGSRQLLDVKAGIHANAYHGLNGSNELKYAQRFFLDLVQSPFVSISFNLQLHLHKPTLKRKRRCMRHMELSKDTTESKHRDSGGTLSRSGRSGTNGYAGCGGSS
ncbi:hypothetical protein Tco_0799307 [Tanacetum coccineum]